MILTARENPQLRHEVIQFGVSQIDGGTKLELGAYADSINEKQDLNKEQFQINDNRSLNEIIDELFENDYLPSFCTACYRRGRTGEHFMEFSVPGFIKRFCSPNAMLTLAEYLEDYAPEDTRKRGWEVIEKNLKDLEQSPESRNSEDLKQRLDRVLAGERDLYY
jgi:2-iminoacetate synthase